MIGEQWQVKMLMNGETVLWISWLSDSFHFSANVVKTVGLPLPQPERWRSSAPSAPGPPLWHSVDSCGV